LAPVLAIAGQANTHASAIKHKINCFFISIVIIKYFDGKDTKIFGMNKKIPENFAVSLFLHTFAGKKNGASGHILCSATVGVYPASGISASAG
jgi:hypothetical protein